jgi:hypothetical protein
VWWHTPDTPNHDFDCVQGATRVRGMSQFLLAVVLVSAFLAMGSRNTAPLAAMVLVGAAIVLAAAGRVAVARVAGRAWRDRRG